MNGCHSWNSRPGFNSNIFGFVFAALCIIGMIILLSIEIDLEKDTSWIAPTYMSVLRFRPDHSFYCAIVSATTIFTSAILTCVQWAWNSCSTTPIKTTPRPKKYKKKTCKQVETDATEEQVTEEQVTEEQP